MKLQTFSRQLIRYSMLAYVVWLLLPAVQTTLGAAGGAACILVFGLGILLDVETLKKEWLNLIARAACAALLPLAFICLMDRGGDQHLGFYVQNAMLWFPLVFVGHVRRTGDSQLWRSLRRVLFGAVTVTLLTTVGWLIEGIIHQVDTTYTRILGSGDPYYTHMHKTLMLRNIGGYNFIYAMVASLPLSMIAVTQNKGWRRWAFGAFLALQLTAIVLSEYTNALVCTALILFVEICSALIRLISRKRVSHGAAVLISCLLLLLPVMFAKPLLGLAVRIAGELELGHVSNNLNQVLRMLQGEAVSSGNRLTYYLTALQGVCRSPFIGSLAGGEKLLSYHSDVLDLLSGTGVVGACVMAAAVWLAGRGSLRGWKTNENRWHLLIAYAAILIIASLGTVVYSPDIFCVVMLGTLLVLQ